MLKEYLPIGKIVSTHGIKGELRVQPWCDNAEFMQKFGTLYYDKKGEQSVSVTSCRPHSNVVILSIEGVDTLEKANALRNKVLYMKRSDAKLPEGSYFIEELIGCEVFDADDEKKRYGKISDVSSTGANDVWHILSDDKKEYLIPAIPPVVIGTDIVEGVVKIRPLRGIFDDEN